MTDEPTTTDETTDDAAAEPQAEAAPAAEPQEQLAPKERRRRARARRNRARPRTPEERAAARKRAKESRRRWRLRERERARAGRPESTPAQQAPAVESTGRRRERQGVVVSAKPDKTITVRIDVARRHRRYEKVVRESTKLHAHDERNDAREGDTVRVVETRPTSRLKRWRLVEIVERAR